jgi:hypothetical protein
MAKKLKFNYLGDGVEKIVNLEEARSWDYSPDSVHHVIIENHLMQSYDELLKLASSNEFKNKETLDVIFFTIVDGG